MQYNPNQAKLNLSRNFIKKIKLKYPNTNDEINKIIPDSKAIASKPSENNIL
jgi:hypothetical protein